MAYAVHPKYSAWVAALENSINDTCRAAFRAIFDREVGSALTPHLREKLRIELRMAALQGWRGFFRICEEYRSQEWHKSHRKSHRKKTS